MRHTTIRVVAAALLVLAAGCGGTNHVRAATAKRESCCDRLANPAERAACRGEIPRVEDATEESARINQQTFYCMNQHFVCDASTGRATQPSAQQQLDCLNDADAAGR